MSGLKSLVVTGSFSGSVKLSSATAFPTEEPSFVLPSSSESAVIYLPRELMERRIVELSTLKQKAS